MNNPEDVFEMVVKIKISDYDLVIGNANFYNFLGDRLYTTFNTIVASGCVETFVKAVSERSYDSPFVLSLKTEDEKSTRDVICRLAKDADPERLNIHMWALEEVVEKYLSNEMARLETNTLLSQYDCVYYSYSKASDMITCYRYDSRKTTLCELKLDTFKEQMIKRLSEDCRGEAEMFISSLANGARSFTGCFAPDSENAVTYSGTAIYDYDVHIKTVGNFGSGGANPIRELVHKDQLTGLALKEDITNYAKNATSDRKKKIFLSIIDIDDFKYVNDHHGHARGDDVLKKCASIIENETGAYGKAGRIGGDEFIVVFDHIHDLETLRNVLRSIKNNIAGAYSEERDGFRVTTSIGAASFPSDAQDYDSLFRLTDYLLYRAKHKGKNRYIIYDREKHGSVEEILRSSVDSAAVGISGRKGLSKAEVVCRIADMVICGKDYTAENVIRDVADHFGVERVVLYNKDERKVMMQYGTAMTDIKIIEENIEYLYDDGIAEHTNDNAMIVNNVKAFAVKNPELYEKLCNQGIQSIIHIDITGKSGGHFVMTCASISTLVTWNLEDMRFYRILEKVLSSLL